MSDYIIQICTCTNCLFQNNCEFIDYIKGPLNNNSINGFYYGSSTRVSENGNVYISELQKFIQKTIRIKNEVGDIIKINEITEDKIKIAINSHMIKFSIIFDNDIIIKLRKLYRFQNCPFEISGIKLISQKIIS